MSGSIQNLSTLSPPTAPTSVSAVPGDGIATVQFSAPASTGGSEITGYTVIAAGSGLSCSVVGPFTYPASCVISGLVNVPTTFTVTATNAVGTGPAASAGSAITPSGSPTAVTGATSNVAPTTATLEASVTGNGAATAVTFVYGTESSLSTGTTTVAAVPPSVSAATATAVSVPVSGLQPGITYYYRVVGQNANSTSTGSIRQFTTSPSAPVATTNAATAVTGSGATLNGQATANGALLLCRSAIRQTAICRVQRSFSERVHRFDCDLTCSAGVSGLLPGTTYYFESPLGMACLLLLMEPRCPSPQRCGADSHDWNAAR